MPLELQGAQTRSVSSRLEVKWGLGIEAEALADPELGERGGGREIEIDEEEEVGIRIQLSRKVRQAEGAGTATERTPCITSMARPSQTTRRTTAKKQ